LAAALLFGPSHGQALDIPEGGFVVSDDLSLLAGH
jgi:hypothetical protein